MFEEFAMNLVTNQMSFIEFSEIHERLQNIFFRTCKPFTRISSGDLQGIKRLLQELRKKMSPNKVFELLRQ